MSSELRLDLHGRGNSIEAQAILEGLMRFNDAFRVEDCRELTVSFKDAEGNVVAGLTGHTDWGWLFVKLLWVKEAFRKQRLGSRLMHEAEAEAVRRGCHHAWLDTFSFQARGFHEKLGYSVFGQLEDYPVGHRRFFLAKRLRDPT
jgi:GNAT superfamily N-acetyltransferase